MYPLAALVLCQVLLAAAATGSDALDDVAVWRQILAMQAQRAARADGGQDARAVWFLPAQGGEQGAEESAQEQDAGYAGKRGISVISRWKPFRDSLSRFHQRARIFPAGPDYEFVSAETRGISRPVGQPLRWGRR